MSTTPAPSLDLNNIQGDILSGLPKITQTFVFIQIVDVKKFKKALTCLIPLIKTVAEVLKDREAIGDHKKKKLPGLIKMVGVNFSISHFGFVKLGIDDSSLAAGGNVDPFITGQQADSTNLGDPRSSDGKTPAWDPAFLQPLHAVILIAGDSHGTISEKKVEVEKIFKDSIKEVFVITGKVRPNAEQGHEHFGFRDGISNPSVHGFDKVIPPGPVAVDPGVMITGQTGDPGLNIRKDWSKNGSFLAFRFLAQLVPEFNNFLKDNALAKDGNGNPLSPKDGSALLGARVVGRWTSGAPIDLAPNHDDPDLANDPKRNNNFRYEGEITSSLKCPFAAHLRKMNPRNDLEVPPPGKAPIPVSPRRIMRRGVAYGDEVTEQEKKSGKTTHDRGLLFACYSSSLTNGFRFLQQSWANNANFQPFSGLPSPVDPGLDPIIGQGARAVTGLDPLKPLGSISMNPFVVSKGGEYFYAPSIDGLKTIAK